MPSCIRILDMKLAQGKLIAERYSILDSENEDASRYLAEDKTNRLGNLQVLVNLRILNREEYNSALLFNRVKKVRALSSDYIIKVFDLVKSSELLAVTSERQFGVKLSIAMTERIFSEAQINYILSQLSKAIEALHEVGLSHGHINEDCIYVDDLLWCKLDPIVPDTLVKIPSQADFEALTNLGVRLVQNAKNQSTLLSPKTFISFYSILVLWLISFLTFAALSPDIGATLLDFAHLIEANLSVNFFSRGSYDKFIEWFRF